jgi:hypothetical protein
VEKFSGIAGDKDGIDVLPDGDFLSAFFLNAVEKYFKESIVKSYKDRYVISGRCAHITDF